MTDDESKPEGNILKEYTEKFCKSSICLITGYAVLGSEDTHKPGDHLAGSLLPQSDDI